MNLGHYSLGRTLGEGTFGKVYMGVHLLTGEKVGVKSLEKAKIVNSEELERVLREIQILKRVKHPHITRLYQVIDAPEFIYLITQLAEGGELFDYISRRGRLTEQEACRFFQQMLAGVEYLHRLKIAHRDLKPENLLLSGKGDIKIADFGLSNQYEETLHTACGSPSYAPPEMLARKAYAPAKADIWSLGIVLFAMVCGHLPFSDHNTAALYERIMSGSYVLPEYLSGDCKDLLRCLLVVDPERRLGFGEIKEHRWFQSVKQDIAEQQDSIQQSTLEAMKEYGFKPEDVVKSLNSNVFNNETAAYYLIHAKQAQKPEESPLKIRDEYLSKKGPAPRGRAKALGLVCRLPPFVNSPRSIQNRTAKAASPRSSAEQKPSVVESYAGPFSVEAMTHKPLQEVLRISERALAQQAVSFRLGTNYRFECELMSRRFFLQIKSLAPGLLVLDFAPEGGEYSQVQAIAKLLISSFNCLSNQ